MSRDREARLLAALAGDPDTSPILRVVWAAIRLRLDLAPAGAWIDRVDCEDGAADLADCAPRLASEVVAAAIGAGLLELRRHHGRQQIRNSPTAAPAAHRKESPQ